MLDPKILCFAPRTERHLWGNETFSLIHRILKTLDQIFPDEIVPKQHWTISHGNVASHNYCSLSILLLPDSELTLTMNLYTTSELTEVSLISKQSGFSEKPEVLEKTDLNNSEWNDFVGFLSVVKDHFDRLRSKSVFFCRVLHPFRLSSAGWFRNQTPIHYLGSTKTEYVQGTKEPVMLDINPGTVVFSQDQTKIRIPNMPWVQLNPEQSPFEIRHALDNGWLQEIV